MMDQNRGALKTRQKKPDVVRSSNMKKLTRRKKSDTNAIDPTQTDYLAGPFLTLPESLSDEKKEPVAGPGGGTETAAPTVPPTAQPNTSISPPLAGPPPESTNVSATEADIRAVTPAAKEKKKTEVKSGKSKGAVAKVHAGVPADIPDAKKAAAAAVARNRARKMVVFPHRVETYLDDGAREKLERFASAADLTLWEAVARAVALLPSPAAGGELRGMPRCGIAAIT